MKIKDVEICTGLLFLLSVMPVQAGEYQEYSVTLTQAAFRCIILEPHVEGQAPAVLLLHGFAGPKDEVGDMYKRV